jgi:hypothetical protein
MTVRWRLAAVLVLAVLAVAALVAWQQLDIGPPRKIVVSNHPWNRPEEWQIAIDDHDRYVYEHGADKSTGRIAFAPFAQRLAAITEIRYLSAGRRIGDPGLMFWIEGRRRTVAPFILGEGGDHAALRSFAGALHDAVAADARRQDAPRITALTSLRDLRAVEAISNGCFGSCGSYTIVFRRDGTGEFDRRYPGRLPSRARAVAWPIVLHDLHDAHLERLGRKYPSRAVDTWSAELRFVFPHATYSVYAPDSSMMPPEFIAAFTALRHLAHATAWTPALDAAELRPLSR